jgi:hypothetical protein
MTSEQFLEKKANGLATLEDYIAMIPRLLADAVGEEELDANFGKAKDPSNCNSWYLYINSEYYSPELGEVEYEYSGGEHLSERVYYKDLNLHYRREGTYSSYSGNVWETLWYEVTPVEKKFIVWEPVYK